MASFKWTDMFAPPADEEKSGRAIEATGRDWESAADMLDGIADFVARLNASPQNIAFAGQCRLLAGYAKSRAAE